jgi:intracellular septation protein
MKLLFDFFPIVFFFITYKYYGIFTATFVTIIAAILQVTIFWFKHRRFEITHIITIVLIVLLGGATLLFHNAMFIKWKPTAIYWVLAIVFLGSHFLSKKPLIQHLMDGKIILPSNVWYRLNSSWITFFILMGILNLYIAYHFNTNTWVNFKMFGLLGCTIVFGVVQSIYMARFEDQKSNLNQD